MGAIPTFPVTVVDSVVAAFSGDVLSGTTPLSVVFTDTTTNSPTAWLWEKNSGSGWVNFSSGPTTQNPTESFTIGTWSVRLTASKTGALDVESKTGYIEVSQVPAPVAAFSGDNLTGTDPLTVVFTDSSTNTPTSWLWEKNSGSGWVNFEGTPTVQNPSEDLTEATWSIRLTATNAGGSDIETKTEYVVVSAGGYVANAVHFDGNTWLVNSSLIADNPRSFSASLWIKYASPEDAAYSVICVADPEVSYDPLMGIETDFAPDPAFIFYDSVGGGGGLKRFAGSSEAGAVSSGIWINYLISADSDHDGGSKVIYSYLNDVQYATDSIINAGTAFDMVFNGLKSVVGSDLGGSNLKADIADLWIAPGQFLDFSVESNRRKFIDATGKPVDLGSDGSTPTGTAPRIFFSGDYTDFPVNQGTGGTFTLTGTLTNASTSPSD